MATKQFMVSVCILLLALVITIHCTGTSEIKDNTGTSVQNNHNQCHYNADCMPSCPLALGGICNHHPLKNNTCSCHQCIRDECKHRCNFGGNCNHHPAFGNTCDCY